MPGIVISFQLSRFLVWR